MSITASGEAAQAQIVRDLEPFVHAAQDMKHVAGAALFMRGSLNDSVRAVLETGLVVSYARPFKDSKLSLKGDWANPPTDEPDRGLHLELLKLRDKVYAHTDRTPWREVVNLPRILGLGGNSFKQQRALIDDARLPRIAALAEQQQRRFENELHHLQGQLPDPGPVPVPLFYRASTAEAEAILANGFTDSTTGILGNGEQLTGVWLRDEPAAPSDDPAGDVLLFLQIPGARVRPYELLGDDLITVDSWVIPAAIVNEYGTPRVIDDAADAA